MPCEPIKRQDNTLSTEGSRSPVHRKQKLSSFSKSTLPRKAGPERLFLLSP